MKEELRKILTYHAKKYPKMQPRDVVKLIFQSEFGGGHMIASYETAFERILSEGELYREYKSVPDENIGFGFVRCYLYGKTEDELKEICRTFVNCANTHKGDVNSFILKLDIFLELAKDAVFPFSYNEAKSFVDKYTSQGCPILRHSDIYKNEYIPAYRIVRK